MAEYTGEQFEKDLRRFLIEPAKRNQQELYECGNCAAFPCFRKNPSSTPAGLCFQNAKQCRQECNNYKYEGSMPAQEGVCSLDGQKVSYCQECHIPLEKKSKL